MSVIAVCFLMSIAQQENSLCDSLFEKSTWMMLFPAFVRDGG